jgi:hypothetical protein
VLLAEPGILDAQSARRDSAAIAATASDSTTPGIADNSFLIEESYNQEPGVVQHISTFMRPRRGSSFVYQFTQEWPLGGVRNQFSYSVPFLRSSGFSGAGVGDIRLNYRYQLVQQGALAVAPRLTMILPTGDHESGRGSGATGVEVWLPASLMLGEHFVAHANAGFTLTPDARNASGDRANTRSVTLAGSVVWLTRPGFNALLEIVHQRGEEVIGPESTDWGSTTLVAPGIRWAYNFPSGLQIVPGVALPFEVGRFRGEKHVFLYLSFEHAFSAR